MSEKMIARPDGRGVLGKDGFWGAVVGAGVTLGWQMVVEWWGTVDLSTFPTIVTTASGPIAGMVAAWVTTKILPRYGRPVPRA